MPGLREREYDAPLEPPFDYLRFRFVTDGGRVVAFLVQYETMVDGEYVPVTRYDTAHGIPHQDSLDRRGNVIAKRWLEHRNLAKAFEIAATDLKANWRQYKAAYWESPR